MRRDERRRQWAPLVETATLVTLLAAANAWLWPHDPGFARMSPHPILVLTLLVLARYGLIAGIGAALLCAAEHLTMLALLGRGHGVEPLLAAPQMRPLVLLVPTAVLIGMLVQRHLDRARAAADEAARAGAELERTRRLLADMRAVNQQLGERVMHAAATPQLLLTHLRALSTLDRQELQRALLRMMVDVLEVEAASVWELDGARLKLSCSTSDPPPPPLRLTDTLQRHFGASDVLESRRVPRGARHPDLPILIGRVRAGAQGAVIGYLSVERVKLGASAELARRFALLVECAATALGNAVALERMQEQPTRLRALRSVP